MRVYTVALKIPKYPRMLATHSLGKKKKKERYIKQGANLRYFNDNNKNYNDNYSKYTRYLLGNQHIFSL